MINGCIPARSSNLWIIESDALAVRDTDENCYSFKLFTLQNFDYNKSWIFAKLHTKHGGMAEKCALKYCTERVNMWQIVLGIQVLVVYSRHYFYPGDDLLWKRPDETLCWSVETCIQSTIQAPIITKTASKWNSRIGGIVVLLVRGCELERVRARVLSRKPESILH